MLRVVVARAAARLIVRPHRRRLWLGATSNRSGFLQVSLGSSCICGALLGYRGCSWGRLHGVCGVADRQVGMGFLHVVLDTTQDAIQPITIWDPDCWKCCEVTPTSMRLCENMGGLRSSDMPLGGGVIFKVVSEERPGLLKFSAFRGFPHLTLEKLHMLWNKYEVEVSGRKPHLLADVLKSLCEFFLGVSLSPEAWDGVQARRRAITHRDLWHSVVEDNPELYRDFVHEQDLPDVQKDSKPRAPRSVVAQGKPVAPPAPQACETAASSSTDGPSKTDPPTKRRKILGDFNVRFLQSGRGRCHVAPM